MDNDWWVEESNEYEYQAKSEFADAMKLRTKELVLRHIKLFQALPPTEEARLIGKQLLRSASSTGANYRAACRARSKAEFFAKLSVTIEEADESLFWLEILEEADIVEAKKLASLKTETTTILKILAKARHTLREQK
ncbi:four helix bundle protein [Telluribacter sp.]|jgi:four helix bundle protein|uniref:four helix bundle protein n=1 Tax=Telluribacter sp. TaxID=1978767 RepID=UPI002E166C8A|nr:four helix bundle protein [Telluribacter sp.]